MQLSPWHFYSKGQLIPIYLFGVSNSPKKRTWKLKFFALAYLGRNFSLVFWENWKKQKVLSKLTDLYFYYFLSCQKLGGMPPLPPSSTGPVKDSISICWLQWHGKFQTLLQQRLERVAPSCCNLKLWPDFCVLNSFVIPSKPCVYSPTKNYSMP